MGNVFTTNNDDNQPLNCKEVTNYVESQKMTDEPNNTNTTNTINTFDTFYLWYTCFLCDNECHLHHCHTCPCNECPCHECPCHECHDCPQ